MIKKVRHVNKDGYRHYRSDSDTLKQEISTGYFYSGLGFYEMLKDGLSLPELNTIASKHKKVQDFRLYVPGTIVASSTVPDDVLKILSKTCHQTMAYVKDEDPLKVFLPKTFYDAFDYAESTYDAFEHSGALHNIRKYVVKENKIGDAPLFRLLSKGMDRAVMQPMFASEEFYELYKSHNLTGLSFSDVLLS